MLHFIFLRLLTGNQSVIPQYSLNNGQLTMLMKLFFTKFDELIPRNKPYDHRIGDGLVLRISATGHRSFQFKYSYRNTRKTMTIAPFGLLTLNEIADRHKAARLSLLHGLCPMVEREKEKEKLLAEQLTINDLADLYLNEHPVNLKRPEQPAYIINRFIKPRLGKIIASELPIKKLHAATSSASPTVARKIAERLNSIYTYAIGKGVINIANPLAGKVSNFGKRGGKTTRILSIDQIKVFLANVFTCGLNESFANASLLLLLTGQRKGEILNAKWSEIDFQKRTLTIPQERLKTAISDNNKKHLDHVIHLSDFSLRVLNSQFRRTGVKERIFAGASPESYNKSLSLAFSSMQLPHFTPHDLRRTFYTQNIELEVDAHVLEKILNHKMVGVSAHYNLYEYFKERKQALDHWGGFLIPWNTMY
jgi:integrase